MIVTGKAAGGYAAFPDICRTKSGDLLCVFYSGAGHITLPSKDLAQWRANHGRSVRGRWPGVDRPGRAF